MSEPIKDAIKPMEVKPIIRSGDNRIRVCRDGRITIPAHAYVFDLPFYYRILSVEREGSRVRIELEILKEGGKEKTEAGEKA
jgi:hypothetical protein